MELPVREKSALWLDSSTTNPNIIRLDVYKEARELHPTLLKLGHKVSFEDVCHTISEFRHDEEILHKAAAGKP